MTVQVEIYARDVDLNDRLRDYITKRVSKLDRYLDVLEEARVDLRYVKSARNASDRHIAQLTVRGKSVLLRAEQRTDDMYASVDSVMEKISRQIERYKGRHWNRRGDGRSAAHAAPDSPSETGRALGAEGVISRRKVFTLRPMDEREAVEQMSLLDHQDFFVFLDATTNRVNVIYRRRDGDLGLIETEIE